MRHFLLSIGILVLMFGEIEAYGKEVENEVGSLYARAAVLIDGDSGRVLYEKNGQEFMANASTTKILTCILALEEAEPEDIVTVSSYAATMPDVQLHIREGEQYRLEDLLYSLMLESHNDVAVAIAEHVSGSVEAFAGLMNQKAKEIGCLNTFFLTPNGLDARIIVEGQEWNHGTTAMDLALLMRYCILQSPSKAKFVEITSTPSHQFSDVGQNRNFICHNHNSLFNIMDGVISGKTGFTSKAGYCYVGAANRDGKSYVVALLACGWPGNKNYKWEDCKRLMEYGDENFQLVMIGKENIKNCAALVQKAKSSDMGKIMRISVISESKEWDTVLLKESERLEVKYEIDTLTAPVKKGQRVGRCRYYINEQLWREEAIYSGENVEKIDFGWCVSNIVKKIA